MKGYFYIITVFFSLLSLNSCKKDIPVTLFEETFDKPYTTGIIKLQYACQDLSNGIATLKDTIAIFSSIGNNPSEKDDYGYSRPSASWVQLHRLNPDDFQNRTFIFFEGTNLDSLILPYTFKSSDRKNAQINYTIGLKPYYDNSGTLINGTNTYAATTHSDNFELTVLSRVNNRLQGIFRGIIKNQDGQLIDIQKGLFDIKIVNK